MGTSQALRTDEAAWIRGETSSRQNQSPVAYDSIVARMELTWINENIHRLIRKMYLSTAIKYLYLVTAHLWTWSFCLFTEGPAASKCADLQPQQNNTLTDIPHRRCCCDCRWFVFKSACRGIKMRFIVYCVVSFYSQQMVLGCSPVLSSPATALLRLRGF